MDQINQDLSFGVSFSQNKRNEAAQKLCTKIANSIIDYTNKLIKAVDVKPDDIWNELQNRRGKSGLDEKKSRSS